jgi:membrane protein
MQWTQWLVRLKNFPWRDTARTLRLRFRDERLGNTASSLTFTTTLALVPLLTVVLAVFTAFPIFNQLQTALQGWLASSLIPDPIARQVMGALTQFAAKASRLGLAGVLVLFVTAISLVLTIDRTLNAIWHVRRPRPWAQRVLMVWAVLTLGPVLLAALLAMSSYALSASRGWLPANSLSVRSVIDAFQLLLLSGGVAALYKYVPHTTVLWRHAWVGGAVVALGVEAAKALLGAYLKSMPTYSVIYGAFAAVPILLLWIYMLWLLILLGATLVANLPSALGGVIASPRVPGWRLPVCLDVLRMLVATQGSERNGLSLSELRDQLRAESLGLEECVDILLALDWVGRLDVDGRLVLLVQPGSTPAEPLLRRTLFDAAAEGGNLSDFVFRRFNLNDLMLQK